MKNVAFISFNTGGTLGHVTLLSLLSKALLDRAHVHVLSEHHYKEYSSLQDGRIQAFVCISRIIIYTW
jgi:ABC-type nitrate/sulfonate/bicarbonate transport system substrate-binding protein